MPDLVTRAHRRWHTIQEQADRALRNGNLGLAQKLLHDAEHMERATRDVNTLEALAKVEGLK